jgi:hypothetical protein
MHLKTSCLGPLVGLCLAWAAPSELDLEQIGRLWQAGPSERWLQQVSRMIEHYPDSKLFREEYTLWVVPPGADSASGPPIRAQLAAVWLRQVERNPASAVIDNAYRAVVQSDFGAAENLLKRARQRYPADPHWTDLLADLYVSAVVPAHRHLRMVRPELVSPEIAGRVRRSLDASRDPALLEKAGHIASRQENPVLQKVFGASPAGEGWGERLLARARQLDPHGQERQQPTGPAFIQMVSDLPEMIHGLTSKYPEDARKTRVQGAVRLQLLICMDGRVEMLDVLSGNPLLVPAAGQAVREARYKPVLLNDEPIAILTELTVNFTLSHDSAATQPPPEEAPTRLEAGVLESLLIKRVAPVRCWECRQISGIVRFDVRIGRDGKVVDIQLVSGHPLLVPAAMDAVRQWVYRPTRVNGTPVEVDGEVDVHFPPKD